MALAPPNQHIPSTETERKLIQQHKVILFIVLLALALRLFFIFVLDPRPNVDGGDINWYMANGRDLVTTGKNKGPLPTAPLYLVFLGTVQVLVPGEAADYEIYTVAEMQTARAIQAVLGALMCWFAYVLGRLFSERAGRVAAVILAISPALLIEAGILNTESLFMFFVFGGLALYLSGQKVPTRSMLVGTGVLFGLATLTRAVFLLFPLGLVIHLMFVHRTRWLRLALMLIVSYGLIVSTWTVYNWLVWDRLVIGAEGMTGFIFQGIIGQQSPYELDQSLNLMPGDTHEDREAAMREQIQASISSDPVGWFKHRSTDLISAYLQPHNLVYFGGDSIRDVARNWWRTDRSLNGLSALVAMQAFWPKLILYLFHWSGVALGVVGMWHARQRWDRVLPLYGMILYFTGIHLVLLALPRYLFPLYPVFWIFAVVWITAKVEQFNSMRQV